MIDTLGLRRPLARAMGRMPAWSWPLVGVALLAYAGLAAVRFLAVALPLAAAHAPALTLATLGALGTWGGSALIALEAVGTLLAAWVATRARARHRHRRHPEDTDPCAD